jgi:Lrp/AsnC ligand binding domain
LASSRSSFPRRNPERDNPARQPASSRRQRLSDVLLDRLGGGCPDDADVVQEIRRLEGVARADALLGTPDIIAIVEGEDIGEMDAVIDRIAELPGVLDTESKVGRWID